MLMLQSLSSAFIRFFIAYSGIFANNNDAYHLESSLLESLLSGYNKIVRPVQSPNENITIRFGASLIRIIDIDEKNQIFTTNLWLEMQWTDKKLVWNPEQFGGARKIRLPADLIWRPDIVLYNNAVGNPDITIFNDVIVYYNGTVVWKPPAIYRSFCQIDVAWFPYDSQSCEMKFGAWSYTGSFVDMRQLPESRVNYTGSDINGFPVYSMQIGMDLSYFYTSAEWDLLEIRSERHEKIYSSCCGPEKYVDVTFYFVLRRKTLFYTVNLIMPCFLISFLTTFVFYLSDHKITFSISILVTLIVFFLIYEQVLIDVIPPTSTVVPMFGRYLLFTMLLVSMSIIISVVTVNFNFRRAPHHAMPYYVRRIFLDILPRGGYLLRYLLMKRPEFLINSSAVSPAHDEDESPDSGLMGKSNSERKELSIQGMVHRAAESIRFIATYFETMEKEDKESNAWIFVGMVIDRLFLIIFLFFNVGSLFIILKAPNLWDSTPCLSAPEPNAPLGQDTLERYFLLI